MTETRKSLPSRFIDGLIRLRFALLALGLLLAAASISASQRLKFDQRIESLYAEDDPHIRDYLESKALFGGDEFVIVAYRDPNLFVSGSLDDEPALTEESRRRIERFTERLNAIPGVVGERTQNLAKMLSFPLKKQEILELSERVLVGDDHQTTAIVLRLEDEAAADVPRSETFDEILRLCTGQEEGKSSSPGGWRRPAEAPSERASRGLRSEDSAPTPATRRDSSSNPVALPLAYVVGEPLQIHYMFRYVEEDGRVLFRVSLALLGAVLLLLFARPRLGQLLDAARGGPAAGWRQFGSMLVRIVQWVGLPLLVVVATILWTEAILVLTGARLSMVSSMLNSIVTIIGIATVTHVTVHYRELRRTENLRDAFRQTLAELLPAVFWTCATTAVGFAALLYSSITPVQSFGLMMALAAALVFAAAVAFLPGGILIGRFSTDPLDAPAEKRLTGFLVKLIDWVERRPRLIAVVTLVLMASTAVGLFRLKIETDFSKNFRESSPLVQGLNFVETELGGAGTWEVNFPAPQQLTEEFLDKVSNLAKRLRDLNAGDDHAPRLTKVVSLTDGLKLTPRLLGIRFRLSLLGKLQQDFVPSLYNHEAGRMRIVLRAREQQTSAEKLRLIADVEQAARQTFPQARATGLFVLLAFLIESLLRDQLMSFLLAAAGIGLMMTLAFRSLKLGLIALAPNSFPIVLVIGAMGWSGVPINIATAMIASVSLGLTVDSTVHYVLAYQRARQSGQSIGGALRECHRGVGRALVFANLALIVGFAVLSLSQFIPLVYFGLLLSVTMLGGLAGHLVLLPLLLHLVDGAWERGEP